MAGAATLEFVARIPGRHFLRNLVERRALVAQLVSRDFRTRYVGSSAGWLWGVVHPIVQLLIWIMVFKYWFGVTLGPDEVTTNYPLFLFCGILPWWLFQETVTRSAGLANSFNAVAVMTPSVPSAPIKSCLRS